MTGSIICGVDDSRAGKRAARVARALAAGLGLRPVFVRVLERGAADEEISAVANRLSALAAGVTDVDGGAGWVVDVGHPADRIVAVADRADAAAIVVGSHGARSSLLGSVSAEVARRASCPVVVVPPGADLRLLDGGLDDAGGLARLGIGDGPTDLDGGIARFALGVKT
jgi:nucleotide-binding universal stress UspA family protein